MKIKTVFIGIALLIFFGCEKDVKYTEEINFDVISCGYTEFKYYWDEPDSLGEMSGDYIFVGSDTCNSDDLIKNYIESKDYFDHDYNIEIHKQRGYIYKYFILKLSKTYDCLEVALIINEICKNSVIDFAHYTTKTDDCLSWIDEVMGELCVNTYSYLFYVCVKDVNNLTDFNNTIIETNTWIRGQDQFMKNWFTLIADKNSKGDAIQMANYFYETGLFDASEPDIMKIPVE